METFGDCVIFENSMIRLSNWSARRVMIRQICVRQRRWGDCFVDGWEDFAGYIDGETRALNLNLEFFQQGLITRDLALQLLMGSA